MAKYLHNFLIFSMSASAEKKNNAIQKAAEEMEQCLMASTQQIQKKLAEMKEYIIRESTLSKTSDTDKQEPQTPNNS